MTKPNFFLVGAPKCGTTWLHAYLSQHPQVFMSELKEPHYFNTDSGFRHVHSLVDYERLFADGTDGKPAIGEASVWYLYSSQAVKNVLAYQPDAKFIVMLRNPVEMAPSLHQQLCFDVSEDEPDFAKAWALQRARAEGSSKVSPQCLDPAMLQYGAACSLGSQLERLYAQVDRDRVLVILLDDVRERPEQEFNRTLEFLGLDPWKPATFAPVNKAMVRRSHWLNAAMIRAARIKDRLGMNRSFGVLKYLNRWNRRTEQRSQADDVMRRLLIDHFLPDIRKIEGLLDRDLGTWYQP